MENADVDGKWKCYGWGGHRCPPDLSEIRRRKMRTRSTGEAPKWVAALRCTAGTLENHSVGSTRASNATCCPLAGKKSADPLKQLPMKEASCHFAALALRPPVRSTKHRGGKKVAAKGASELGLFGAPRRAEAIFGSGEQTAGRNKEQYGKLIYSHGGVRRANT